MFSCCHVPRLCTPHGFVWRMTRSRRDYAPPSPSLLMLMCVVPWSRLRCTSGLSRSQQPQVLRSPCSSRIRADCVCCVWRWCRCYSPLLLVFVGTNPPFPSPTRLPCFIFFVGAMWSVDLSCFCSGACTFSTILAFAVLLRSSLILGRLSCRGYRCDRSSPGQRSREIWRNSKAGHSCQ